MLLFGFIPALGIAADLYLLVQSFFIELWAADWATGKSVVVFDVACAALVVVLALRSGKTPPDARVRVFGEITN